MPAKVLIARCIATACVVAAIVMIGASVIAIDRRPRTHDAYIYAYSAGITPEVSGRIVWIGVSNNHAVHQGDVLLKIDPEPFQLKRDQAQAHVASLQAQIALTGRQVGAQGAGAQASAREVDRARQQLALATNTRARLEPLLAKGFATVQQVDQAKTDERAAQAQWAAATEQASQAKQAIGDVDSLRAQLLGAQAAQALAERDLRETIIRAPVDGQVLGWNLAIGSYATAGRPLFTLIDTHRWYAVANFRETDLGHLHVGDKATAWLMGQEDRPVSGSVESIDLGVRPQGQIGPDLPEADRNLNWVIVAQRFPVWIRLDPVDMPTLRIGATVSVRVQRASH